MDETAYWRVCVQFGPDRLNAAALKAEGEKLLGAEGLKRLRSKAERYNKAPFAPPGQELDLSKADWREQAIVWFPVGQGDSERAALNCRSPAPPAEWASPDFDAAAWPRQRLPLLVGNVLRPSIMHGDKDMQQLCVRAAFLRTTFDVPDPAKADYTLSLSFRGGARVLLNGQEVARGHLSPGGAAEGYPAEAYVCLQGEVPPQLWEREMRKIGVVFCEELVGRFDDAFADATPTVGGASPPRDYWTSRGASRFAGYFGGWTQINRAGFERVTKLRNRTLGPLVLPRAALRKGTNLLAIELHASPIHPVVLTDREANWGRAFQREMFWSHCRLIDLALEASDPQAPSALERPRGVQVWVEDVHRQCYNADFGPGGKPGVVRFVGAANGTYSAQVVVGTDRELKGMKATARIEGLPADSLRVGYLVGHPATELVKLGQIRNMVEDRADPLCPPAEWAILRYGPEEARSKRLPREQRLKIAEGLAFFDHIGSGPPAVVPANTCQPLWLSLTVPPNAEAGVYRGTVRVEAGGIEPVSVPVEAEVAGWRLPDPLDFQTVVALEQSPYGVAKHYGVEPWSDAHFRLLDASFRQLARVGNDLLFIPCIQNTEFGNHDDTPIRWTRRKDGALAFDYRILDRYLDLAVSRLGKPLALCLVVMHGADRWGPGATLATTVALLDEATGETKPLDLRSAAEGARECWKAFATDLHAHLREKGLADAMFWGFCWDSFGDPKLPALLGELVPEVKWARSSHDGHPDGTFALVTSSLGREITETSLKGWANRGLELLCPRSGSTVLSSNGHSPPFTFRLMAHRALVAGYRGVGRLGADYWADIFFRGYKGSLSGGIAGMPCSSLLWPGKEGAESSARFEALREGLQETEARIYLEQALDRGLVPKDRGDGIRRVLDEHNRQTLYISPGRVGMQVHEHAAGWQERSRLLYGAAAKVAEFNALDVDRTKVAAVVPARSITPLAVTLRNWTPKPRPWRAAVDQPWLVLKTASGTAQGHQDIALLADANRLKPEATDNGALTLTDIESGRAHRVEIAVRVGKVLDLVMPAYDFLGSPGHASCWDPKRVEDHAVFNVAPGGADGDEYALVNHSGAELSWTLSSSARWLAAEPAAGKLGAGQRTFVKLTARPPDAQAATHNVTLTLRESGGSDLKRSVVVHVIPPYAEPRALSKGEVVHLADVPKSRVVLHKTRAYWLGTSDRQRPDYGPRFGPNSQVERGGPDAERASMHAAPEQVTAYNIEGMGFAAFSASVRINPQFAKPSLEQLHRVRVSFEVHVDGALRAQSGLMTAADDARLLVVEGLAGAKELKLLTRFDRPEPRNHGSAVYAQWREARFYK
ncbi:MAG TPA: glycoside hydrolase domain-containing protein [Planctomycetota bacterium]|nr:glycoside hydrolase domain-containing protein [Planctomycetota bacterium]